MATQADLDAGSVTNIATAAGSFDGNPVSSVPDTVTVNAIQNPSLAVDKVLTGANPNLFNVGTVLSCDFGVTNDGSVTIQGPISISDSLTTAVCPAVPVDGLVPGGTLTCTATDTLRAGDLAVGSTTNVATASGSFAGQPVLSPSDGVIYPVGATPALTLTKDSVPTNASFAALGDRISYTYSVTNTGAAGLTSAVTIDDNKLAQPVVCHPASAGVFQVGDVATCTAIYTVTQADLDAGFVTNQASASAIFAPGTAGAITAVSPPVTKTVSAATNPALSPVKDVVSGPSPAAAGDVLIYRIRVTNTGNQTMTAVTVSDPLIPALTCTIAGQAAPVPATLLPGEVLQCRASYSVQQADLDAQSLSNTATASGTDPAGAQQSLTDSHLQPLVPAAPAFDVQKSLLLNPGVAPAFTTAGQPVTFVATVRNLGNITLAQTVVADDLVPGSCTVRNLAPGASDTSCRFTYFTTHADVDAVIGAGPAHGGFTNTLTARAQPANPGAPVLNDTDALPVLGPDHAPAFALAKTADLVAIGAPGQVVTYNHSVTNSGNITLTAQPVITDDKIGVINCGTLPTGGLAPNAAITCTAPYTVTQADVDAGGVTNIASVASTEVPLPNNPGAAQDSVTLPSGRTAGMSVVKTASIPSGAVVSAVVGDVITYSYAVANTGNVVLRNVTPDDQHTSAAGTQALAIAGDSLTTDTAPTGDSGDATADGVWDRLAPGDVVTFTATYTVTQADMNSGTALSDTVQVTALSPNGTAPPTATDTLWCHWPLVFRPSGPSRPWI